MRVDVSEIKSFRECKLKHQFNSRNRFHLRPVTTNVNFIFGTQFHEVLHMIYLGTDIDKVLEYIAREVTDVTYYRMMCNMAKGYYEGPYQLDKDRYQVVDIERGFSIPCVQDAQGEILVECVGSIDMICIDLVDKCLVGFEHKTAKNFRSEIYNKVDEQPRVYEIALHEILKEYHNSNRFEHITEVGPIYLNQVKKLLTKFAYERTPCVYSQREREQFFKGIQKDANDILCKNYEVLPVPGFMKCQMCDYAALCDKYAYEDIELPELLEEFSEEFHVRACDHLDEKTNRQGESDDL